MPWPQDSIPATRPGPLAHRSKRHPVRVDHLVNDQHKLTSVSAKEVRGPQPVGCSRPRLERSGRYQQAEEAVPWGATSGAYVGEGRASRRMWRKLSHGRHRRCGLPESSSVTASTVRLGSNACRARWPATHPLTLVENFCLSRRCPSSLPVDPGERPAAAPVGNKALSSVPGVLLCRPFPMIFPSVRPFFRPSLPAPSASTGWPLWPALQGDRRCCT